MKKNIFIFSSGELKREGNTLCFISGALKKFVPISEVSSIFIFGETTFNKRFLEFISSNEVTLHVFNYYGYYVGSFYPRTHYNAGYMTLKQCEHYLENSKRVELARKFVEGGLKNMLKNLMYYNNRGVELSQSMRFLGDCLEKLERVERIDELMAIEGNAKEEYYISFNEILKDESFSYKRRERRPPKSRLNALLSFGNSLIYVTILGEIYKTHLDPRIGFLHASNFRKFSLNLDVAEIFKPIIADRVIFSLVNKRMLDDSCFAKELEGIYLSEKGRRIFIQKYDEKLKQVVSFKRGRRCSYQRLIRLELYKIERHLIGEQEYQPFVSQW
ncbi:MAG: type I-B CRISPR-associated endonuclease Cas1b [Nitrososphaerota archaeon]